MSPLGLMLGSKGVGLGWLLAGANAHFYLGIAPGPLRVVLCGICRAEGPVMELALPWSFSVQSPCGESETARTGHAGEGLSEHL